MSRLTPVKHAKPADRARQALLIVQGAVDNCQSVRYQLVHPDEYRWWLSAYAASATNEQLAQEVRTRLVHTNDERYALIWRLVLMQLDNADRSQCATMVDRYFTALNSRLDVSGFNIGVFNKTVLSTIHPFKFNQTMSEVL